MGKSVREIFMGELSQLRYEPIEKRIRGMIGERAVIDTTRAILVWEPKRITPSYAVPVQDIDGELVAAARPTETQAEGFRAPQLANRPVYDPHVPFAVHTAEGEVLDLRTNGTVRDGAGFRVSDAALSGYVVLDFNACEQWYEEDELNIGHPRDPFHRIEILHSSRPVRVELHGELLAESSSPYVLLETPLPMRYYLPPGDIAPGVLVPSATRTICAYKGHASYWSVDGEDDIAWTYAEPLREAAEVVGRIAFFNERVDLIVDGAPLEREVTPWSRR